MQNANGGLANSAIKVGNPRSSSLLRCRVGSGSVPNSPERNHHRHAVEHGRERLRGADPYKEALV